MAGAEDLTGNPMANDFVWTFSTGSIADTTAPMVSSTDPVNGVIGVPINKKIAASFSEAMYPLSITTASFTLRQGTTPILGTVTYPGVTATFAPVEALAPNTLFTATITAKVMDLAGNALASDCVWTFTTGAAPDTTAPMVSSTDPADAAIGVPLNKRIAATFSETMAPLTITAATFTLDDGITPVSGSVTYVGVTATFAPADDLAPNRIYTATVLMEATDLAGNPMAEDYVWTFTTGTLPDAIAPTVINTNPSGLDIDVCLGKSINATFSEAMDPLTVTTETFTLYDGITPVSGKMTYVGITATFAPKDDLAPNTTYTATVLMEATDLAGNGLELDFEWSFTTDTQACASIVPEDLGAAAPFGGMGGAAGMTNQGIFTLVNGDIATTGASTLVTGFHDTEGNVYTKTPLNIGMVNGAIYTAPPPGTAFTFEIATQALASAQNAYVNILSPAALPGGTDPFAGQLGGKTVAPGIYQAAGGSFQITGSDLTLDAQGDANAVWVFQSATTLTVGDTAPRSVALINGAQAKNVYWWVGSAATINGIGGGIMAGTIIAYARVTFSTAGNVVITRLNGRALGLNASVTLVNTNINVPAP